MDPILVAGDVLIIVGAVIVIWALRYRVPNSALAPSLNPKVWSAVGPFGSRLFTPRGRRINIAGWVTLIAGVLLTLLGYVKP